MSVSATAAIVLAIVLDEVAGEWPDRYHPVRWFGRLVSRGERDWARPRLAGALLALVGPLVAAVSAWAAVAFGQSVHPALGTVAAGLVLFSTSSLSMLRDVGESVIEAADARPKEAKERVRALVGRDAEALSPGELRSGVVESVAENLADGFVAPLFAFVLGAQVSLPLAAAGASWVKAVNTLDSMVGYPSISHGSASARLDDCIMWIPARLSAVLLAVAAARPSAVLAARRWRSAPPSPNSGWPMGTLAAILDVELRKPGQYRLNPGRGLPTPTAARHGVRYVESAGLLAAVLAGVVVWL